MTTIPTPNQPDTADQDKPRTAPATGKDADAQPADSTHDENEADRQVQRTETEGPRRMPQP